MLVVALLLVTLVVFGQSGALAKVTTGVTITYWFQHSGTNGDAMQKMIADFNATNQWKITVKGEYAGPYDQIYNKMVAGHCGEEPTRARRRLSEPVRDVRGEQRPGGYECLRRMIRNGASEKI